MKDEEAAQTTTTATTWRKECTVGGGGGGGGFILGKRRYKLWALAAVLLLTFWSILTGSVTLKFSSGNLNPLSDDFDSPILDDFDTLELEEREKMVRHMWDVYTHSSSIRLPRFWLEAFQVAYEDLTSDVPAVRNVAVSEIARMSFRSVTVGVEPPPVQSTIEGNLATLIKYIIKVYHWYVPKRNSSMVMGRLLSCGMIICTPTVPQRLKRCGDIIWGRIYKQEYMIFIHNGG